MSFFRNLLGLKPKDYAAQRQALQSADMKRRMSLARDSHTSKEILYYLADQDPEPKVRKAVVENKAMPVQVSPKLAIDPNVDVRLALAGRLVDLLPDLSRDMHSQLYAFAVQALGTLALDEVLKIRTALASTLKDHAHTPPKVAGQLARDVEREVSEPILRFCAALSDEDLLDILRSHPASWVIQAVAGRNMVSAPVSAAVIETRDRPGGKTLIENEGAVITESLLQQIVEMARSFPEWQKPMALRKALPISIVRALAEFVDASVRDLLMRRGDFDEQATEEIAAIFRRRMEYAAEESQTESTEELLQRMIREGKLDEKTLADALGMRDRDFAYGAIAYLAKVARADVQRIFDMQAAKPIVALAWKAGLSMRMAFQLQRDLGKVQPRDLLYPRDGTDYPMTLAELQWQLEFLGLKAA